MTVSTRSRMQRVLPVLVPLASVLSLIALLLVGARTTARSDTDAEVRANLARSVTQVSAAIRGQIEQAASVASASTTIPAGELAKSEPLRRSLIEARDSGVATLQDATNPASIVVPVYRTAEPPKTTQARRAAISGYRVLPLTLGPLLAALAPEGGGLAVRGPSREVAAEPRPLGAGSRAFVTPLDLGYVSDWSLQGWLPTPGAPVHTWLWLVVLLVIFAALAVAATYLQHSADASRTRQNRLEQEAALVAGLAVIVQSSLDLGEIVPAVSAHLVTGLNLAGLSLSTQSETGERPVFCWGAAPDESAPLVPSTPTQLAPGQTYLVILARGGRRVGALRVVAGTPLTQGDLRALETASELLCSTLVNAEAFAHQQAAVERMRTLDEMKTVFLATASHELRTPVAAILGFSTVALDMSADGDFEMARPFLERVIANARSLTTLTEQLLDFSRLERGMKPSTSEVLDLAETTRVILDAHLELTAEHRLVLKLTPGCMLQGSTPAVARIVTNLVGNAAKYSPADTAITVTVRPNGDAVELLVEDEGPGVAEIDRDRVFSRFYRGGGDEVARTSGTGVGLAIVAEFAASMSGSAEVQTAPTGGARFVVTFPAFRAAGSELDERASHDQFA